jgi:hypothetical protein
LSRGEQPILKLWWNFRWNSFVSYWDKNLQTFSLKSRPGSFVFSIFFIWYKWYHWQIMVLGHTRGLKYTNHRKQLDYTIAIVFISCAKLCQYPNFNVFEFSP